MNETTVTVVGNMVDDPSVRYLPSGAAVSKFSVANNPRRFDKDAGLWKDADPLFMNCTAWNTLAENIGNSLRKGMRVVVTGRLRMSAWQTEAGEKRTGYSLDVEDIGASLLFAEVSVTRTARPSPAAGTRTADRSPA